MLLFDSLRDLSCGVDTKIACEDYVSSKQLIVQSFDFHYRKIVSSLWFGFVGDCPPTADISCPMIADIGSCRFDEDCIHCKECKCCPTDDHDDPRCAFRTWCVKPVIPGGGEQDVIVEEEVAVHEDPLLADSPLIVEDEGVMVEEGP